MTTPEAEEIVRRAKAIPKFKGYIAYPDGKIASLDRIVKRLRHTKKLKRQIWKTSTSCEEYTEEVPTWYYRLLLWIFGHEEVVIERTLREERQHAWDKGYADATKTAHHFKEQAMQKKLDELGYEVKCNFPMARMNPELMPTEKVVDPRTAWEIVPK